jgi:hypothetical protein
VRAAVVTTSVAKAVPPELRVKHEGFMLGAGPDVAVGSIFATRLRLPHQALPQGVIAENPLRLVMVITALTVEPDVTMSEAGLALTV